MIMKMEMEEKENLEISILMSLQLIQMSQLQQHLIHHHPIILTRQKDLKEIKMKKVKTITKNMILVVKN